MAVPKNSVVALDPSSHPLLRSISSSMRISLFSVASVLTSSRDSRALVSPSNRSRPLDINAPLSCRPRALPAAAAHELLHQLLAVGVGTAVAHVAPLVHPFARRRLGQRVVRR